MSAIPHQEKPAIKTLYDTLEFEEELGHMFADRSLQAIWIISPWIKRGAFSRLRSKQIATFLALSSTSKVYLIYSMPEGKDDAMMDDASESLLRSLRERFPSRVAIAQFPNFHYKQVITEGRDGSLSMFSGSFNILSFSGKQAADKTIRAERMTRLHSDKEIKQEYAYFRGNFERYKRM